MRRDDLHSRTGGFRSNWITCLSWANSGCNPLLEEEISIRAHRLKHASLLCKLFPAILFIKQPTPLVRIESRWRR